MPHRQEIAFNTPISQRIPCITFKFNNFLPDVLAGMRERIAINEVSFQEARIACRNYFIKSKIIDRLMDNAQYIIGE